MLVVNQLITYAVLQENHTTCNSKLAGTLVLLQIVFLDHPVQSFARDLDGLGGSGDIPVVFLQGIGNEASFKICHTRRSGFFQTQLILTSKGIIFDSSRE